MAGIASILQIAPETDYRKPGKSGFAADAENMGRDFANIGKDFRKLSGK